MNEGVIRFRIADAVVTGPVKKEFYADLEKAREVLYSLELIGFDDKDRVGYGNLSKRIRDNQFLISGSQTGGLSSLDGSGYTFVRSYRFDDHSVSYEGPIVPSSESLTHAAFYQSNPQIAAVIHIHSDRIWEGMKKKGYPATSETALYGTVELAQEIIRIGSARNLDEPLVVVMKGHKNGVLSAGKSIADALGTLLEVYNLFH